MYHVVLILMGGLPFPKQKQRRSGLEVAMGVGDGGINWEEMVRGNCDGDVK